MKKAIALFLFAFLLLLSACGSGGETESTSLAETVLSTETEEPITAEDVLSANDFYGRSDTVEGIRVRDESVCFRTDDSRRLQSAAIRAALEKLRASVTNPDSLAINDCIVFNCADDGECTYYEISCAFSHVVASGDRISSDSSFCIGVRKSDKSTFDASEQIDGVLEKYSIFTNAERKAVAESGSDEQSFFAAAKRIAQDRMKVGNTGKVLSAEKHVSASDETVSVWDVLCEGENSFGMRVPDIYTVYLRFENGRILEIDPADPDANNF